VSTPRRVVEPAMSCRSPRHSAAGMLGRVPPPERIVRWAGKETDFAFAPNVHIAVATAFAADHQYTAAI